MKVYLFHHEYDNGNDTEIYKNKHDAMRKLNEIIDVHTNEGIRLSQLYDDWYYTDDEEFYVVEYDLK